MQSYLLHCWHSSNWQHVSDLQNQNWFNDNMSSVCKGMLSALYRAIKIYLDYVINYRNVVNGYERRQCFHDSILSENITWKCGFISRLYYWFLQESLKDVSKQFKQFEILLIVRIEMLSCPLFEPSNKYVQHTPTAFLEARRQVIV